MAGKSTLRVGTRDSILARLQTDLAMQHISLHRPDMKFEVMAVKTSGDKILNKPLAELGGRGAFTKELEESLLANEVDFVVHSLKDLPTELPEGLHLAATINRADHRDVLVSNLKCKFAELPAGSRVASSSRRRAAQLSALRKDIEFVDIRGNIQTRMRKLDEGQCDAMILAAAGLERLGLQERVREYFEIDVCMPAVGQGALGIECRKDDVDLIQLLSELNDAQVWACVTAERAFLNILGSGCSLPVGAFATIDSNGNIKLKACVASLDGTKICTDTVCGVMSDPQLLGRDLADRLLKQGAGEIIKALLEQSPAQVSPP